MSTAVVWLRRDLRLADHPALLAALDGADSVLPLFVFDPILQRASGAPRLAFLDGCLADLHRRTGGALVLRTGDPEKVVVDVAEEVAADGVYVTEDFGPYGHRRDQSVAEALATHGRRLVQQGTPYAVPPGELTSSAGSPFQVFTPFYRAWRGHARLRPEAAPDEPSFLAAGTVPSDDVPASPGLGATEILPPGEEAGLERLERFLGDAVDAYGDRRDLPGVEGTSRLSVYLKYGCLHPRQVLDRLGRGKGAETYRKELAWREFYAHVLYAHPSSARCAHRSELAHLEVDTGPEADDHFDAWASGRTGYPIVDAGMRQLLGEAWVHNRVRMVAASFLVKDLHLPWQRGARLFMQRLQDGDLASNNHGWQWVAGTGTDAAPFFRIFNPVTQGRKFDPEGAYIRRWVPELRDVPGPAVHEPWTLADGPPHGYPLPIVEHDAERKVALARYAAARGKDA